MQAYVFTDRSLARYAGQFVWLSVDGENSGNSSFLRRYPVEGYPSFYVIDPASEKVALRWMGGATVAQIGRIFDDGRRAVSGHEKGIDALLARADRLYGESKNAEAAKAYTEVLAAAPKGWSRFGRTTENLLFALQSSSAWEPCATRARDSYAILRNSSSAANVAATGLDCALNLPAGAPLRSELIKQLEQDSKEVLSNTKVHVAADDRSAVYQELIAAREDAKDEPGQRKVTEEWSAFLDREAAAATTPQKRAVYDSHRMSAYLALGQPERAIPMLEQSARDFPADYNPQARLAVIYKAMKQYDAGLAASDKALAAAYGPRKLGILRTRAELYEGKGDLAAARKTIAEAVALAEAMPEGQRSERTIAALKKKLESYPQ